jgi:predicted MFS family arabinose efflux permease
MPRWTVYAGFAVFGAFWGAWGASLPAIRDHAGISEAQLGTALLFIGAGALPAMLAAGRAVDRRPRVATAVLLALFGAAGVVAVAAADGMLGLAIGLALLGATSGAADVAINTAAGFAQRTHGGGVIARAHATFSASVVVASLLTGAALAADVAIVVPFAVVAAAAVAVATAVAVTDRRPAERRTRGLRAVRLGPLLVIGGLGALAFAVESAHQNWSALYLRDVLDAGPALAATGPALFAAVVALTRFSAAGASGRPVPAIMAGALIAMGGTAVVAAASSLAAALAGFALAAVGTAVLFPTLLVVLTDRVPDHVRGSATSAVTTVAYLGFLAGPAYVGVWADAVGLPGAMLAVAALAAALAALAPLLNRQRIASTA